MKKVLNQKKVIGSRREAKVVIITGPHRISEFLVTTRPALFSESPVQAKKPSANFYNGKVLGQSILPLMYEVSTMSLMLLLGWLVVKIAVFVFWLPNKKTFIPREVALPEKRLQPFNYFSVPIKTTLSTPATLLKRNEEKVEKSEEFDNFNKQTQSGYAFDYRTIFKFSPISWRLLLPQSFGFAAFSLVLVLPIWLTGQLATARAVRAAVVDTMKVGVQSFIDGASAFQLGNFEAAGTTFELSLKQFQEAKVELDQLPLSLSLAAGALPQGKTLASVRSLVEVANSLASVATDISASLAIFQANQNGISAEDTGSAIVAFREVVQKVTPKLATATAALAEVDPSTLPEPYVALFTNLRTAVLPPLRDTVRSLALLQAIEPRLLGAEGPERYLFVFQNDYELRASGGFMGSFALIDVRNGAIKNIEFPGGGTYDLEGSLTVQQKPPLPLTLVANRWEFQDANWWVDWPTSARKIAWFYDHSGGSSVDGIVAVDTEFMQSMLEITGPISLPAYGITVDKDTFVEKILNQVEVKYDRAENKPKQILADLLPIVIEKISQKMSTEGISILGAIRQSIAEKHILVYSQHEDTEQALERLGWSGSLFPHEGNADSLSVVHTNLAGQKTDGVIVDKVTHEVSEDSTGGLNVTLSITRKHNGIKGAPFTGVRNVDYLRVYVPEGSQLTSASGFETIDPSLFKSITQHAVDDPEVFAAEQSAHYDTGNQVSTYQELSRTVFGGWLTLDPGTEKTVTLRYRLPSRLLAEGSNDRMPWLSLFAKHDPELVYRFYWEKQPGTTETEVTHSFAAFSDVDLVQSSMDAKRDGKTWVWQFTPRTDSAIFTLFKNR